MFPALCARSVVASPACSMDWSGSRYSLLFELFVLSWLKISTVDAVRKQLKISWNAVDGIMTRVVKRGLSRMKKPLLARHMNVDEVAFKKV